MYMYLSLPKDLCDVRTPVAPEEKNIVDMLAMDFSIFYIIFSSWNLFMVSLVHFGIL